MKPRYCVFEEGDEVEVKNEEDECWMDAEIKDLDPISVVLDGEEEEDACSYSFVRQLGKERDFADQAPGSQFHCWKIDSQIQLCQVHAVDEVAAAIRIQAMMRGFNDSMRHSSIVKAVKLVQAMVRHNMSMFRRAERFMSLVTRAAVVAVITTGTDVATVIQALFRGRRLRQDLDVDWGARAHLAQRQRAARTIQRVERLWLWQSKERRHDAPAVLAEFAQILAFVGLQQQKKIHSAIKVSSPEMLASLLVVERQKLAELKRADETKKRSDTELAMQGMILQEQQTKSMASKLGWDDQQKSAYAAFEGKAKSKIGLEPLKQLLSQMQATAVGRHLLKEPYDMRNVVIEGAFGTGKRTTAELIAMMGKVLGVLGDQVQASQLTDESATHVTEVTSLQDIVDNYLAPRKVYYIRLGSGSPKPNPRTDGMNMQSINAEKSIVIFSGEKRFVDAFASIDALRKRTPTRIILPSLNPDDLAAITAQLAQQRGYRLLRHESQFESETDEDDAVKVMRFIISQRYTDAMIRDRNAHLALDMLDLAVDRKNERLSSGSSDMSRMVLTAADFDVKLLSQDVRDDRRRAVDDEVTKMIGWDAETRASCRSPKAFFEMAKRTLLRLEKEQDSSFNAVRQFNWNVVATGASGTGKGIFARLLHRFLRAYGVLESEELLDRDAAEFACGSSPRDQVIPTIAGIFNYAAGGGLLISQAHTLAPDSSSETRPTDMDKQQEVVRALSSQLEESRTTTMVVLSGSGDKMGALLRAGDGSIQSYFQYHVHISDYSATEITEIVCMYAQKQGYAIEPALLIVTDNISEDSMSKLATHIDQVHGGEEDTGNSNGRLAVNLVEQAIQLRAVRMDIAEKQKEKAQYKQEPPSSSSTPELTASDFGIGEKLGDAQLKREIDQEVADMIGMAEAKQWFEQLKNKVRLVDKTGDRTILKTCMHMIITGNPGTGKTTFTRLLFRFLHAYGILSKDVFVEKNGLELKGQYIGDTGPKVKAAVAEAKGGCLFLDEAYALCDTRDGASGGGDSFSREAIRTLLTEVENNRTNLMCVMAGYRDKMDKLMRCDPGLDRRFQGRLHLQDYSPKEIAEISELVAFKRFGKAFEEGLQSQLAQHIQDFHWRDVSKQNGGLGVNLVEKAVDKQANRLVSADGFNDADVASLKASSAVLTAEDFSIAVSTGPQLGDPTLQAEMQEEVKALVGLENVKKFFETMKTKVQYVERGGDMKTLRTSMNMVLTGNPGVGKTTVARLVAKFLHAYGILPTDRFVEKNALELKGQFVGQTGPTVKAAVADAMGGCLFIDEAYALCDRGGDLFSGEAIRMLLTEVENNRTKLLVILAGYEDKMEVLLDADPGLRRRFPNTLHLSDYSPYDLARICEKVAVERFDFAFKNDEDARDTMLERLSVHIRRNHAHEIARHNGGLAVNLTEAAIGLLASRVVENDLCGADAKILVEEDYGISSGLQEEDSVDSETKVGEVDISTELISTPPPLSPTPTPLLPMMVQVQMPSGTFNRPRTQRVPPKVKEPPKFTTTKVTDEQPEKKDDEDEKAEEKADDEEDATAQTEILTRLRAIGVCPQSFEWEKRSEMDHPCGKCAGKNTVKGAGRRSGGYQCAGGSHWVCTACLIPPAAPKVDRFD
jgi:SpoVK/Ycf46/Vps4 family AAA+-type ATPase